MALHRPSPPSRFQIWLPLLLAGALAAGILIGMRLDGPSVPPTPGPEYDLRQGHHKIEELIRYIEAKYVDEVDRQKLVDEAITSILHQLDPHSSYIPAEELARVNEQMEGQFLGIGVEFMILEDTVVVVGVSEEGPAKKAGILAGDKIVSVDDSLIAGKKFGNNDVVQLLRGEEGARVKIGIIRLGQHSIRYYNLARQRIPIKSVDAAYLINNKVAYIRVNRFSATTDKEFLAALEKLAPRNGPLDLILDLRHNPGGYLQQASNMLSQIFPERGELLVYTEGRAVSRSDYLSTGRAFFKIGKVAVLIDEGSASASEILAGAVQDHDRGIIIGRRSFGKGLVQEQYRLHDGSAIRLTVARYYTPSGRSIQKPYKENGAYALVSGQGPDTGTNAQTGRIAIADSTRFYTTSGRVVYSGGGIDPDVIIPLDSTLIHPEIDQLRLLVSSFILQDDIRALAKGYEENEQGFAERFEVGDEVLNRFRAYGASREVRISDSVWSNAENHLKLQIKVGIARNVFGPEAFFRMANLKDPAVLAAVEQLDAPKLKTGRKIAGKRQ